MLQGEANEMACYGHGVFFGCGLSLLILGLFVDIGGFASQYWINYKWQISDSKFVYHSGLWQTCHSKINDLYVDKRVWCCEDFEDSKFVILF